jgi:cell division protein FtsI (penicillin-binding protein 3)
MTEAQIGAQRASGIPRAAKIRAIIAGAVLSLAIVGVGYRAWLLQIGDAEHYRTLAERQHEIRFAIPAPRGDILDANRQPLAISADVDSIWASPREVRDVTATAERLAQLLPGDAAAYEAKLGSSHRFVWLARHVAPDVAAAVRAAKLPGIDIAREPRRWYPARSLAGPVLGGADVDGRGIDGVEKALDVLLAGKGGEATALRDARGHAMFEDGSRAEPGATVQLTLDRTIEAIAEDAIADAVVSHQARSGVAVVLDVATSQVLALASYPTFDPNTAGAGSSARDRAVTDAYEAGSVMKVFSVAIALDAGAVTADTPIDVTTPPYRFIHDVEHDTVLTVGGVVKRSSNVGAAKIALRLGRLPLYAGLQRFGFGTRTGIELPGEQSGMLRSGKTWREIELATIAYGYGLTVTPLQAAAGLAAIGNGGVYRSPRIVARVTDASGATLYTPAPEPHRVIAAETAAVMKTILASVFDKGRDGGTAKDLDVPGFRCGGKTGTAHKYDPVTHQYANDRYLSSFAGLAPIDAPRIAVVVMVDEPSGGDYYGGKVAGPVFGVIASQVLRYLGVPGQSGLQASGLQAGSASHPEAH